MANVKISALPAATLPLAGTEELPLVQSTATKKVTVDSINANATLQQVTAGTNKDLTNDRNLQGTDAGNGNTGVRINALGHGALKNNTGDDVNAFGTDCGIGNSYDSVNLFGYNATADDKNQSVFANFDGTNTLNARLSYITISNDRKYELPDASGTLVLSVNGNAPDAQGDVTIAGGGIMQQIKVSLTSSDILTLNNSTPFVLIAAPGAGQYINVVSMFYVFNFVTSPYSSVSLRAALDSSGFTVASGLSNLLNASATTSARPNITGGGLTTSSLANNSLGLFTTLAPTGGDGTLDVYVTYNVITL